MKNLAIICLVLFTLVFAGCVSDAPATAPNEGATPTAYQTTFVDESVREKLTDQESERVLEMLSHENYTEYSVGGMGTFDTTIANTTRTGVYVRVAVPYTYRYTTTPEPRDTDRTATPVETVGDGVSDSLYLVNESGVSRVE